MKFLSINLIVDFNFYKFSIQKSSMIIKFSNQNFDDNKIFNHKCYGRFQLLTIFCQAQPNVQLQLGWDGLYCWSPLPTHPNSRESPTNAVRKLDVQTRSIVHMFKLQKWQNKNLGCHCATQNDFPNNNRIWKSHQINYPRTPLKKMFIGKQFAKLGILL